MASVNVRLPDGTEQSSTDIICEGCDKPMSEHSCGGSVTISTGGAAGSSFKTSGRRKDPKEGPLCPHCQGRLHTNMPSYLQNLECIARQYGVDSGKMADPFGRVPLLSLDDIAETVTWARGLKTPITYGKMESAAGGSGTYASLRPKAEKRARKTEPAKEGERIEDLAKEVASESPREAAQREHEAEVEARTAKKTKAPKAGRMPKMPKAAASAPTPAPSTESVVSISDAEERRAKRRALLAGKA